jgi:hypothetical protein
LHTDNNQVYQATEVLQRATIDKQSQQLFITGILDALSIVVKMKSIFFCAVTVLLCIAVAVDGAEPGRSAVTAACDITAVVSNCNCRGC